MPINEILRRFAPQDDILVRDRVQHTGANEILRRFAPQNDILVRDRVQHTGALYVHYPQSQPEHAEDTFTIAIFAGLTQGASRRGRVHRVRFGAPRAYPNVVGTTFSLLALPVGARSRCVFPTVPCKPPAGACNAPLLRWA